MLSSGDEAAWLTILDNATLALSWTSGMELSHFADDRKTFYATTRALEIISEAARRLGELEQERFDLPWRRIKGAGNIYRHQWTW